MELIEKMAEALKIEPYHFFVNRAAPNTNMDKVNAYPKIPESMKNEISSQMDYYIKDVIKTILNNY